MRYAVEMEHEQWVMVYQALKGYGNVVWHDDNKLRMLNDAKRIMRETLVGAFHKQRGESNGKA
jgi:hypothetical protein